MRSTVVLWGVLGILLFAGLVEAKKDEPVQVSPDTYVIFREDHKGIFGSLAKLKAKVIREANEFAAKQGKIAIPISAKEKPMGNGPAQWASFEYQFRVVSKDDPEAKRTNMTRDPNVVIENNTHVTADIHTKDDTQRPTDVYGDLIKLDELRKRGVLTEAEFQTEKAKILGSASETSPPEAKGPTDDLYSQLTKLDELRKKGILTDAEFDAQKKKLLARQ